MTLGNSLRKFSENLRISPFSEGLGLPLPLLKYQDSND